MKRSSKAEFSSRQKAEIYARDLAMCCFSGKSLWLLDFGAAPSTIDWVDHIIPVSKGGATNLDNGACASWLYNWIKREHRCGVYLFRQGYPTQDFYTFHETLPASIASHIHRFSALHYSDWYFNRALFQVLLGASQGCGQTRMNGHKFVRGIDYRASAALRFFERWHKESENTTQLNRRGLVPKTPSPDHKLLLSLRAESTVTQVRKIIKELAPYVEASWETMESLAQVKSAKEAKAFLRGIAQNQYVVPRVKKAVRNNLDQLYSPKSI